MNKTNIEIRRTGDIEKDNWGYSVLQIQGNREVAVYGNGAELIGDAYVMKEQDRVFDAKNLKTPREKIESQLYGLAKKVAINQVKHFTPELIDNTGRKGK